MSLRACGLFAFLMASAANAAEEPRYAAPPPWVEVADIAKAKAASTGPFVILDRQVRAENGTVSAYVDYAIAIDSPRALTQFGTLSAEWLPDKGALTIHRAALLRDGVEIDLLAKSRFTVLRREQQLERRTMDGLLTATMPVAGARIGDIVRLTFSVDAKDAALKGEVQNLLDLPTLPDGLGMGRLRMSWPEAEDIAVSAGPRFAIPAASVRAGYRVLEVPPPPAKSPEMPGDAPPRYHAGAVLRLSSFDDWRHVSRTMSPLFASAGTIAPGSPIAAEVARIQRDHAAPRARAGAALKLVQDRIAYLAQGMDGGNYVPQSPEATWETRFGDCKAKTLLLVAMLRAMDIAADPVLVHLTAGDGVAEGLAMPGAFDHVLVRAVVDGAELWLDGTSAGTQAGSLEDVPPFAWGLPLVAGGSDLVRLPSRAPAAPTVSITSRLDASAGVDFPVLYDVTIAIGGQGAAGMEQLAKMPSSPRRDEAVDGVVRSFMGEGFNFERAVTYDSASGLGSITAKGMAGTLFDLTERRALYAPQLFSGSLALEGNRARPAWRDIPVVLPAADRRRSDITVILPPAAGYSLTGGNFERAVPGGTVTRTATLADNTLRIREEVATSGGELTPAEVAANKAGFAAIATGALKLRAPQGIARSWDKPAGNGAPLKAIEAAYARLIEQNPEDVGPLTGRASLYSGTRDHKRALADIDRVIALEPSADYHVDRAVLHQALGDFAGAANDAAQAAELDPTPTRKGAHAFWLGLAGRADEGLALMDQALAEAGADDRMDLVQWRAELLARAGRAAEGLEVLREELAERPGDRSLLNALCWQGGLWQADNARLAADCDAAVNASDFAPDVLDSRALANLRLGRLDAALADADAALLRAPGQDQTLLLRGLIRQQRGDRGGADDIAEALRRRPGIEREYIAYGVLPKR